MNQITLIAPPLYVMTAMALEERVGIELLAGNVQRARVKGGVYYQNEWNVSSYTGKTEHKDKWIICIGTER